VRAKAEGRELEGMNAAGTALFPDGFEESELGLIPKGWKVQRIQEVAAKVAMGPFGSNIKVATFVDEGVPIISGQHLKEALLEDATFNFITEEHAARLSRSLVREGDIIFTHAGNIGQVSLIPRGSTYDTYVLSQRQFYLRCNSEAVTPEFMTYYFRSPLGQHRLLANASQVGVPSIARPASYLKSLEVVVPPGSISRLFTNVVTALHDSIVSGRRRIKTLSNLRDTLLPRLISGKLHLPEAEAPIKKAIEEAVA
jgi:type I restriction enzyme S subunit